MKLFGLLKKNCKMNHKSLAFGFSVARWCGIVVNTPTEVVLTAMNYSGNKFGKKKLASAFRVTW